MITLENICIHNKGNLSLYLINEFSEDGNSSPYIKATFCNSSAIFSYDFKTAKQDKGSLPLDIILYIFDWAKANLNYLKQFREKMLSGRQRG